MKTITYILSFLIISCYDFNSKSKFFCPPTAEIATLSKFQFVKNILNKIQQPYRRGTRPYIPHLTPSSSFISLKASSALFPGVADTTYKIVSAPGNSYGYEIIINNKIFIRQRNIPGLPGVKGFTRKSDAMKVAKLVIIKMRNTIMPPTIARYELDSLQIKLPY